jgi:hypothetical protein
MVIERAQRQPFKNGAIIFLLQRLRNHLFGVHRITGTSFVVKNLRVEFLLGGKMPKHHRLRDAGCLRDLLSSSAAKTALREKPDRYPQDLQFSVFRAHACGAGRRASRRQRSLLNRCFFTQIGPFFLLGAIKVSTYLPSGSFLCQV